MPIVAEIFGADIMKQSAIAILAFAASSMAQAEEIKVTYAGSSPIAITGLVDQDGCHPDTIVGKVVKRTFNDGGILPQTAIVEQRSGERSLVNIDDTRISEAGVPVSTSVVPALQVLLREGGQVRMEVFACGAAGRVLVLNSVRAGGR